MDKKEFDEIVAGIWAVYSATTTLSSAGVLTRAQAQQANQFLEASFTNLRAVLETNIDLQHANQPKPVNAA